MHMQKEIMIGNEKISYALRRSTRARRMRLAVHRDGSVVLTTPARYALSFAEEFVYRQRQWLIEKLAFFRRLPPPDPVARYGRREYLQYRESARALVMEKIDQFHVRLGGVRPYGRVSIRNQKTCWGSCSRKGNLNFNYKLLFLPAHLRDYVIVHELAHLSELNHSPRFWALVGSVIPDWRALRRELRERRML
jgi:predicted metal-dependent hydrolase